MPRTEPPGSTGRGEGSHWFEGAADHLGAAYLRYSFTKGTRQEVDFLLDALALQPGERILDVGCGPGRHALEFAARGFEVVGVDISQRFVDLANASATRAGLPATFQRQDARRLQGDASFDVAVSLCQGAFGLQGATGEASWSAVDEDAVVLGNIAASLRPGGRLALSAFSAYFQVRFLESSDSFDAATGVNHELSELRDEQGDVIEHDLWTTCFTPTELRLLAERVGLEVMDIFSVEPGRYGAHRPNVDTSEYLLIARKP